MTEQHPQYDDTFRPVTPADIAQEVEHDVVPGESADEDVDEIPDDERLEETDPPELA